MQDSETAINEALLGLSNLQSHVVVGRRKSSMGELITLQFISGSLACSQVYETLPDKGYRITMPAKVTAFLM